MTSGHFDTIERLFNECLEREACERGAFLERACAGDPLLRRELEALLAVQPEAGAALAAAVEAALPPPAASQGERIGPYRLVRELGRGGMGVVFLAERADEAYHKQVALKLVQAGLLAHRFRQERQILAGLEHPYIARLLDGGVTPGGLPYLVMEFVEGEPLLEFCHRHELPLQERLRLFLKVCEAVQYAHRNLVVHRDLKPGNILVTTEGRPKLLDFGIAKLLRPGESQALTETRLQPLTPQYASPEQVAGAPVTTAVDVYALGAILYELLTGAPAHVLRDLTPQEIVRVVCQQDPVRPSAAARSLPAGDLDHIVLTAMRKEPERRYASVERFAEDIQRYLDRRPVLARKGTFAYRSGKFLGRHKLAAAAVSMFVVSLMALTGITLAESARTARERDKANRISDFLVSLFTVADPGAGRGARVTAQEVLDQGATRVPKELSGEPDVQAALFETMGKAYHGLGAYDRAQALLEQAVRTRRTVLKSGDADLAGTWVNLASVLADKGETAGAERLYRQVLGLPRGQIQPRTVAQALSGMGLVRYRRQDWKAAEPYFRQALAMRRDFGVEDVDFAGALADMAMIFTQKRDWASAEPLFRQALALYQRLQGHDSLNASTALNNLAVLYSMQGRLAAAEPYYRQSLQIKEKVLGENHPVVAMGYYNLANFLAAEKKFADAEPAARRCLDLRRKLLPAGHQLIGDALVTLGKILVDRGDLAGSVPLLRQGLEIRERTYVAGSPGLADAESSYGLCLAMLHRYREAEPWLAKGYPGMKARYGASNPRVQHILHALSDTPKAEARKPENFPPGAAPPL